MTFKLLYIIISIIIVMQGVTKRRQLLSVTWDDSKHVFVFIQRPLRRHLLPVLWYAAAGHVRVQPSRFRAFSGLLRHPDFVRQAAR